MRDKSERIERIHFAESSGLHCEKQKNKFCYPSLNIGKEDTIVRIVSVWDRSRDSTHRIFFLEHKMRPLDFSRAWFSEIKVQIKRPMEWCFLSRKDVCVNFDIDVSLAWNNCDSEMHSYKTLAPHSFFFLYAGRKNGELHFKYGIILWN